MARTYQQQLDDLDVAIAKVESKGQSHSAEGRSMTRADLSSMYAERERLQVLAAREARGGISVRRGTPVDG